MVIVSICWRITPAIIPADDPDRQAGKRASTVVRSVKHPQKAPAADWGRAIAFALAGDQAATTKCAWKPTPTQVQKTSRGSRRKHPDGDRFSSQRRAVPHDIILNQVYRTLAGGGECYNNSQSPVTIRARLLCWDVLRLQTYRIHPIMSNTRTILLVDDDDELREQLREQLGLYDEFEVLTAATAGQGMEKAKGAQIDLLILDVQLPDMDGREACKLLRKNGFKSPVIMLTGNVSDADMILGLDSGANDYVTKPFKFAVLLARMRAQLRQHDQSEDAIFTIGVYSFKPAAKLLLDEKGGKIRLTEKETSILKYLYRAGEKVVTRDVLLAEVWGYNSGVTTHTLETHIYRLRQKIEKDPSNAELLVTETGGYKLVP